MLSCFLKIVSPHFFLSPEYHNSIKMFKNKILNKIFYISDPFLHLKMEVYSWLSTDTKSHVQASDLQKYLFEFLIVSVILLFNL